MGSKKRSAKAKQVAQFKAQLSSDYVKGGSTGEAFAHESRRRAATREKKAEALREKSCASKKRYNSRFDAECAINACADYGTTGLKCYKCEYCNGWHLTSHPWDS